MSDLRSVDQFPGRCSQGSIPCHKRTGSNWWSPGISPHEEQDIKRYQGKAGLSLGEMSCRMTITSTNPSHQAAPKTKAPTGAVASSTFEKKQLYKTLLGGSFNHFEKY